MSGKLAGSSNTIKILNLALIIFAMGIVLFVKWQPQMGLTEKSHTEGFVSSGAKISYDYGLTPELYYSNGSNGSNGGVFFCTKDGMKRYDTSGNLKWDVPLSVSDPRMIGDGGFAAVSEPKGKRVYVFAGTGLVYELPLDNELLSVSINGKGSCAVISQNAQGGYTISTTNPKGEKTLSPVIEEDGVFPVCADISGDGRVLAVSTLNTMGLQMFSSISFYYINAGEAQSFSDGMFAASPAFENQMISRISFAGDNKLIYISDKEAGVLETGSDNYLKSLWRTELSNEIKRMAFIGKDTLALAMGKELINKTGYDEGSIVLIDVVTGNINAEYKLGSPAVSVLGGETALVACGGLLGRSFYAINPKGSLLWEYNALSDSSAVVILDKNTKIACATPLSLEILEWSKPAANKEASK